MKHNKECIIDDEDWERISNITWYVHYNQSNHYVFGWCKKTKKYLRLHRVILNAPEGKFVDHKNRNTLDNRKENLRLCNHQQNSYNRSKDYNNKSGYKGVSWSKQNKKWMAQITYSKTTYTLGFFKSKEDAALAYNKAVIKHHGEFAYVNKIE